MGTYFSPGVPEVYLTSRGRVSGASLTSGGSLVPISPLGSLWGDCIPAGDHGSMGPPYPGSLGSLFSSQDSWESLRHASLGPSLFPGKGVISEACLGRGVPGPPSFSALGVSDLQHFGKTGQL